MSKHFVIGPCRHGVIGGCKRDHGPPCETCQGQGVLSMVEAGYYGNYPDVAKCPNCKGTGVRP